ncbi:replication initiation protein [Neisseria meningitidis]|nr:replication initiation protein [Neisseria meningitidis]
MALSLIADKALNMETLPSKLDKTPQALIHIKHSMTELQYKLWYLMLKNTKKLLEQGISVDEDGYFWFELDDLFTAIGYRIPKKILKKDLEAIRIEPMILNYLQKDGNPATKGQGYISEWDTQHDRLGYKFPTVISKALLSEESNKMFLLMDWQVFNAFKGKYEGIIYKLCKDYEHVRRTPYFPLEHFRGYMGFEETEYLDFRRLNNKVLKPSIEAINKSEKADLIIQSEFKREGRKVVGLHFTIAPRFENKPEVSNEPEDEDKVQSAFSEARIEPNNTLIKFLKTLSVEQFQFCIKAANGFVDSELIKGKTVNIGAIYNMALKENWGEDLMKAAIKKEAARLKQEEDRKQQELAEQEKQKQLDAEKKIADKENLIMIDFVQNLEADKRESLYKEVRQRTVLQSVFDTRKKEGDIKSLVSHPVFHGLFKEQIEALFNFSIDV